MSLDDIVQQFTLDEPDYIKIDTDGFDLDVLQSGRNVIAQYRPMLQIDCGRFWAMAGLSHLPLLRWADDFDYLLFSILPNRIIRITSQFEIANQLSSFNVFGCPRELYR